MDRRSNLLLVAGGTVAASVFAWHVSKRWRRRAKSAAQQDSGGLTAKPSAALDFEVLVVDYQEKNAPELFTKSLKETGFAVLTNHPVAEELIQGVYNEWNVFLKELDSERRAGKMGRIDKYKFDPVHQDGYFPMNVSETAKGASIKDIKQYFHLYFPNGRYPDDVSSKARDAAAEFMALGRTLVEWIDEYMPKDVKEKIHEKLGGSLADEISQTRTLFRVLHYPAYDSSEVGEGAVRAAAHEDINLITVLPAASTRGLQVKDIKGQWHEVPCVPGSIIVNIGDMLQELSEFAYKSTTHRVIVMDENDTKIDRMATPCFIHFKSDTPISDKYPTAEDYLFERLKELGVKTDADKIPVKPRQVRKVGKLEGA